MASLPKPQPMLTAQPEPFAPFLEEVKPYLPEHYKELALNQDKVPLAPQYDEYLRRDAAGAVLTVTLRGAGELVGYFVGFVFPGLHYSTCLTLITDIYWLRPDMRGNGGGVLLFKAVEREAKRRGVQRAFFGFKLHSPAPKALFDAMGYEPVETYYSAWWGD
jgi:GNAT superfamily N-acetyltransferase